MANDEAPKVSELEPTPIAEKKPAKKKKKSAKRKNKAPTSEMAKMLADLNDGTKSLSDVKDLVALNTFANTNADLPLGGTLREDLNRKASEETNN